MNSIISVFPSAYETTPSSNIDIDMFLDFIRDGKWQDDVLRIRAESDEEKRNTLKKKIPAVTISGRFSSREDKGLVAHSNYIALDFDHVENLNELKEVLSQDPYCYAIFQSVSGRGLCMIVRIDGSRHRDAFEGLQSYFYNQYQQIITWDKKVKNESRLRFVSFDPDLLTGKGNKFTKYITKERPKVSDKVLFVESDFIEMIKEVEARQLNICETYDQYYQCGFAVADKFGEAGRNYFHRLCQFSPKYDPTHCDKQYDNCLKARGEGIGLGTLFFYLKKAGVNTYSKKTQLIASIASAAQKGAKSKEDTINNLIKHEGLTREEVEPIVRQVFDDKLDIKSEDSVIYDIKNWLKHNYDLRLNSITQYLENRGKQLDDTGYNSIFVEAKTSFGKDSPTQLIKEILGSDFVPSYNPIHDFFRDNKSKIPRFLPGDIPQVILDLWSCIKTDNPDLLIKYGTKWLVSIISAAHYQRSELMLIFTGDQNVGKSQFFIRLLPDELRSYFGMPSQMKDTDLHIAMGQKLLMLDDEVSGKTKKEDHVMKKMLSAPFFTLRKPFGHTNVDILRLSVWCGTSNPDEILTDTTGNRRYLPFRMISQDFEKYNSIDKTELFMAAYQMWKDGFDWQVSKEDMKELKGENTRFEAPSTEYELITKYFKRGNEKWTSTDIRIFLQKETGLTNISIKRIGEELNGMGIHLESKRVDGLPRKVYMLEKINTAPITPPMPPTVTNSPDW